MDTIIFDMDGVLVDSEPVILRASMKALKEYGVLAKEEDFIPFIGTGEDRFIGGVSEKYGVEYIKEMKDRTYEIYLEIVEHLIKKDEKVISTLNTLKEKGIKLVLASSADRVKIRANLKAASIDESMFLHIIGGDDVNKKKPDPEIYLLALSLANAKAEDSMVIEDAVNGIIAAKRAKIKAVGLVGSFKERELKEAKADIVINDFEQIVSIL